MILSEKSATFWDHAVAAIRPHKARPGAYWFGWTGGGMAKSTAISTAKGGKAKRAAPRKPAAKRGHSPRAIETALATFAHDIRTPLTGILAFSELLATSGLGERESRWIE